MGGGRVQKLKVFKGKYWAEVHPGFLIVGGGGKRVRGEFNLENLSMQGA